LALVNVAGGVSVSLAATCAFINVVEGDVVASNLVVIDVVADTVESGVTVDVGDADDSCVLDATEGCVFAAKDAVAVERLIGSVIHWP
jgi:hypothetical protein